MTPKEAGNKKLEVCSAYFNKAKNKGIKFKKRHLSRLAKEVDKNISLSLTGSLIDKLNTIWTYNYNYNVRINEQETGLQLYSPIEEILYDSVLLGSLKCQPKY